MAQFSLINPSLRIIGQRYNAQGKPEGAPNTTVQNAGKKYLYAQLMNNNCPWEGTQVYTSFLDNVVAIFEPLLPIDKGGTAPTEQPIPDAFKTLSGCYVSWKSPQPFYKKHLSAHPANPRTGSPAVNQGDIVKQGGVPVVFTEIVVFCQYYFDEMGEKQWIRGGSPEEVGRRAFSNYCIPVSDTVQLQNALANERQPQPEIVGGQVVQPANPQSQQPTQQPQPQTQQPQPQQPQFMNPQQGAQQPNF